MTTDVVWLVRAPKQKQTQQTQSHQPMGVPHGAIGRAQAVHAVMPPALHRYKARLPRGLSVTFHRSAIPPLIPPSQLQLLCS